MTHRIHSIALLSACVALVVLPIAFYEFQGIYVFTPVKQSLLAMLGLWLLLLFLLERLLSGRALFASDGLETCLFVALGLAAVSALAADVSRAAMLTWLQWAGAAMAFVFVRRNPAAFVVTAAILVGAALTALVAYAQLGRLALPGAEGAAAYEWGRAAAQSLLPMLLVGFAVILFAERRLVLAGVVCVVLALPAFAILHEWTTAAALAGALLFLLVAGVRNTDMRFPRRRSLGVAAILVLTFVLLAWRPEVPVPQSNDFGLQQAVRADSLALLGAQPFSGIGPGQFTHQFPQHAGEDTLRALHAAGSAPLSHPFSDPLAWFAAVGWPAGLALLLFFLVALKKSSLTLREHAATSSAWQYRAAAAMVLAWLLATPAGDVMENPFAILALFAALGVLAPLHASDDIVYRRRRILAPVLLLSSAWAAFVFLPQLARGIPAEAYARRAAEIVQADPQRARQTALKAVRLDPHNARAFRVLGQAPLMGRGMQSRVDYLDAEDKLRRALRLYPSDYLSRYYLGVALYERADDRDGNWAAARNELEQAAALHPGFGPTYLMLALVDARGNARWPAVRANLDRAFELDPALFRHAAAAPELEPYRQIARWWRSWYEEIENTP